MALFLTRTDKFRHSTASFWARGVTRPRLGIPPWRKVPKDCPPPPPSGHGCENAEDCDECCNRPDAREWAREQCMEDCLRQPATGFTPVECVAVCSDPSAAVQCVECLIRWRRGICEDLCRTAGGIARWLNQCREECNPTEEWRYS
jgi:hypothetical protein